MDLALARRLETARAGRVAAIVLTDTGAGASRLVLETDDRSADSDRTEIEERFRSGRSGFLAERPHIFATVHVPPPRLVAIGAVHISQALAPIAAVAGFALTVIDPRTAFATPERFAGVDLRADWPDEVLPVFGLDRHTGLAALTHDPKIDDGALDAALRAGCFYVGALGSRRTHAKRLERLAALGHDTGALDRIRAPIGLDIGAQSPAEIAVAVMAEVIATYRRRAIDGADAA